eukprot:TRINITY_DN35514_c0_g1_i1.p1 TRINITY_DN35514_c0_g1~~TRINITY_DN35514_c0_g1_i1.p1  ORF type:complete len:934 (+),score=210.71 TRINITY_DN35514_c0_g1_i1:61-2862(+)
MGNAESQIVRNVDKRTSRREHRATFEAAAKRFRAAPFEAPAALSQQASASRCLQVCIRKRPMFKHEFEQSEFDVITALEPGRVVVHDARMHPDMVNMFMNHHDFSFDKAFHEGVNNAEVYAATTQDLVASTLQGGNSTVMMYGQTGSGKTYTMRSIYEQAAEDIFAGCDGRTVTICFTELLGDNCFDMLNQGTPCQLQTAADGSVHPFPCVEVPVDNAAELLAMIDLATKLRATAATGVHDQSSRSHALCRIFVEGGTKAGETAEGSITLVDLAGSEHRIDNAEHNAERRKEGAKINASLAALKDCVRAAAAGAKFVAFRQNRLTQLLRGCFVSGDRHQTVVIATVSPSSKDTEHSLNTLRHACIMDGQGEAKSAGSAHLAGGLVTKEKLGEVDVTRIARERKAQKQKEQQLPDEWGAKPEKPAHQSKKSNTAARAALDRKCVRALDSAVHDALMEARAAWGTLRQRRRLARPPPAGETDEPEEQVRGAPRNSVVGPKEMPTRSEGEQRTTLAERQVKASDAQGGNRSQEARIQEAGTQAAAPAANLTDNERAFELFRLFCCDGRHCREWRKNDLRLINSFVVPLLYGPDASIDWARPVLALDELERLAEETPPPKDLLKADYGQAQVPRTPSSASRPPMLPKTNSSEASQAMGRTPPRTPSSARPQEGQSPVNAAAAAAGLPPPARPPPRQRASTGEAPRRVPQDSSSKQTEATSGSTGRVARSASPSVRLAAPVMSHQESIRARREALEKERQESLQRALSKPNKSANLSREEEMSNLEAQIASGQCSAAAAVGLKKRLQSLKAAILREERAAAAKRTAGQRNEPVAAPQASSAPQNITPPTQEPSPRNQYPGTASPAGSNYEGGYSFPGINDNGNGNNYWRPRSGSSGRGNGSPLACGPSYGGRFTKSPHHAVGAAAAPWANELSNPVTG